MNWDDWKALYQEGYFDESNHLRLEYVRRDTMMPYAQQIAKGLSRTQARRFFQHCRRIEQRLKVGKTAWEDLHPDVIKLDEVAADAISKDQPKIPDRFHDFIMLNVRATNSRRDFLDGFMRHFEAFIAFGYPYFTKERGRG